LGALVEIIKERCNLSYSCVRACPVNAIEVKRNTNHARIIPERCIGCGSCVSVCPEEAIVVRDAKELVKELLNNGNRNVAIVAPSISGEFEDITDYRKFVQMLREMGFDYVNEVSFGADIIALKYQELFQNFKGKYYISTACPVVVNMIERFQPELIKNLAPLVSPMIATAQIVRQAYGSDIQVTYIGPCIDSKNEALRYNGERKINAVLTYVELRELFTDFDISESKLEFSDFDTPIGYKGSLFPIANGLLQAANSSEDLLNGKVITAEGKKNMLDAIHQFAEDAKGMRKHLNLFYCEGCLMGPGTSRHGKRYLRHTLVTDYANKRLTDFDKEAWKNAIDKYLKLDYSRNFTPNDQRIDYPSDEKINEVLKAIGKDDRPYDVGCQACGYESCKDFAVAVSKGLAKTEMCLTYTLRNRQVYIKALRNTNEVLAQTKRELEESKKNALKEKVAAQEASETIHSMLQKLPSGVVILNQQLKVMQSNQSFIDILGEEAAAINEVIPGLSGADLKSLLPYPVYNLFTQVVSNNSDITNRDIHIEERLLNLSIFTIQKDKTIGAVFRDMYSPEVRTEEIVKRVTDVIDKNLAMVQNIGFLLGEGASETEQMLNTIIELYKNPKKTP